MKTELENIKEELKEYKDLTTYQYVRLYRCDMALKYITKFYPAVRNLKEYRLAVYGNKNITGLVNCPECGGTGNPCSSNVNAVCKKCKGSGKIHELDT